jgi:hypothetical protein
LHFFSFASGAARCAGRGLILRNRSGDNEVIIRLCAVGLIDATANIVQVLAFIRTASHYDAALVAPPIRGATLLAY